MMRCCIKWYAHFSAAREGVSGLAFLEPEVDRGISIDLLTSIAKRTASLEDLYP
jgi:hypothetical protein